MPKKGVVQTGSENARRKFWSHHRRVRPTVQEKMVSHLLFAGVDALRWGAVIVEAYNAQDHNTLHSAIIQLRSVVEGAYSYTPEGPLDRLDCGRPISTRARKERAAAKAEK